LFGNNIPLSLDRYKSQGFQVTVAIAIFANFVVMAAEAEMRPTEGGAQTLNPKP